jgi:hypothetical protein
MSARCGCVDETCLEHESLCNCINPATCIMAARAPKAEDFVACAACAEHAVALKTHEKVIIVQWRWNDG